MPNPATLVVSCNGGDVSALGSASQRKNTLQLAYDANGGTPINIRIGLPRFVADVYHLSPRLLDLLEIAAYVYCADRHTFRGAKDALEYHAWSLSLRVVIRVRDYDFWSQPQVKRSLEELLCFLSGYKEIAFTFQPGHATPPTNLFDAEDFAVAEGDAAEVMLFSGGVDSLTGAVELLATTNKRLLLVSHRSGLPSTSKTQDALVRALSQRYPGRIQPVKFHCGLTGDRAAEETQRTRFFLYTAIAFALSTSIGKTTIQVFENGVTSLNFPKRQDLMLGRASRTTHPKTIALLTRILSLVAGKAFMVATPYFDKTKTDVLETLRQHGGRDLLDSSVSCSKTFKAGGLGTQCGGCSQCVDRRFAAFASGLEDCDSGLYAHDFITQEVKDNEARAMLVNFLGQASDFTEWSLDGFYTECASELSEIVEYLEGLDEDEAVTKIYNLCVRHGQQVKVAIGRMRDLYDDPFRPKPPANTVLRMIDEREYMTNVPSAPATPTLDESVEAFISYSHRDEKLRGTLENHLRLLERQGVITNWHDRKIGAGTEWEGQINEHLETAQVILLLVSSNFLGSNYCNDVEVARAMQRHEAGEAQVIPIILRDCDWTSAPFGKLQALPTDGAAITGRRWQNQDEAFTIVAKGIREAVKTLRVRRK